MKIVDQESKKQCFVCNEVLPFDSFHKDASKKYGLSSRCKECGRKYAVEAKRRNPEYRRQQQLSHKKTLSKYKGRYEEYHREWANKIRKTEPKKFNARIKASNEVMIEGGCYFCNSTANLVRHHYDYDKPLDVYILCKSCHAKYHHLSKLEIPIT